MAESMKVVPFTPNPPSERNEDAKQPDSSLPVVVILPDNREEKKESHDTTVSAPTPASTPVKEDHPIILVEVLISFGEAIFKAFIYFFRTCFLYLIHHPYHAIVNVAFLGLLALVMITGAEVNSQLILNKISDSTIDQIIQGSRFSRPFSAEDVERTGTRELIGVGAPEWIQRESIKAILFYARKANLPLEDQAVLLSIADIESGFNPLARAPTTSACGLFQFIKRTGEIFSMSQSECMDPWKNARAGVDHYLYNFQRRVQKDVADLTGVERAYRTFELSYYLHHDGSESSNPGVEVKATVMNGSQFLFKTYRALIDEAQSQRKAPGFTERFSNNLWKVLNTIVEYFKESEQPFVTSLDGAEGPKTRVAG